MPRSFRIAYFAHSLRSDWNNGNAHFLRGLMRALGAEGHTVTVFEPEDGWSIENLRQEPLGAESLAQFAAVYPELDIVAYRSDTEWRERLAGVDVVILHEWNPPELAAALLALREQAGFKLLFHDTHHRASSSPEQIALFGIARFDGVLAFGETLRGIYRERFGIDRVWTFHEAADTTVFQPLERPHRLDGVWIGNWGEGERSGEIRGFLLEPAARLRPRPFTIFGVRYPADGLAALSAAAVEYGGYLPNLDAPATYAAARLTMHIPRQQYTGAMTGIPTIRVFEALACGIPLVSAPWPDTEALFRAGDYWSVASPSEAYEAMRTLLEDPGLAAEQAARGLETVLARHTCAHRAQQLTDIVEELFA